MNSDEYQVTHPELQEQILRLERAGKAIHDLEERYKENMNEIEQLKKEIEEMKRESSNMV